MFNVIRIPTKFCRTIRRFSEREKSELLDMLISIGEGDSIIIPDNIVGDTLSLIYGEWMNMESRNGHKSSNSLIQYGSEGLGTTVPGDPGHRIEENRIEENRIEENKLSNNNLLKDEQSSIVVLPDKRKSDINDMQSIIKNKVNFLGLIYKSGRRERPRIQNILTSREFGEICEKASMSRPEFVLSIIELSTKLQFWNGKIYNAETLYKHYAQVYNEAVRIKVEKQSKKPLVI